MIEFSEVMELSYMDNGSTWTDTLPSIEPSILCNKLLSDFYFTLLIEYVAYFYSQWLKVTIESMVYLYSEWLK